MDVEHAFDDEAPFDLHTFTLPTSGGPAAPARFRTGGVDHNRAFDGVECKFMDSVFFRQEVLAKYEGADGFTVDDDGSVSCGYYWALDRSTYRLGNDLLHTSIGDFAEGVPFEEWPHWRLYAVEPPSYESSIRYRDEPTIAESVNRLAESLAQLNHGFELFANVLGLSPKMQLWSGSLDSLAGRQLKWYYPHNASDDEFLKRAVLMSTFVSEELSTDVLRAVARALSPHLHRGDDGKPLGSRRLLERLTLIAKLVTRTKTAGQPLVEMVAQAEGAGGDDAELLSELRDLRKSVRKDFAPIAFLYDLRNSSGVAHSSSITAARQAAINLGLPSDRWARSEYLALLQNASRAIDSITSAFRMSAVTLANLETFGNRDLRAQRA
jgi:predicted component of type VI protein secretion system